VPVEAEHTVSESKDLGCMHQYKPMLVASMSDVAAATQDDEQKLRRNHGKLSALCTKKRTMITN
jgi:hypothetical protein